MALPGGTALPANADGEPHADLRHLSHEPALVNKIMKKRQEELARRTKLFDTRRFRHGVTHDVLDAQIAEKKEIADAAKAEDDYYDKHRVISDQVAQVCETIRQEATRERQKATTAYSLDNLRRETRREYDLSDPTLIKRERPARDGDNDERLGKSSIQNFEGEDFLAQKRKKDAQASTRDWLTYQIAQKKAYQEEENRQERLFDEAQRSANEVRGICEQANIQDLIEEKKAESAENQRLAQIHRARRQAGKEKEMAAVQAHVDYEMKSDRMMELSDYKLGVDGRLMKAEYKRLSVDEEQNVHDTNARLILEQQARKRAVKNADALESAQNLAADMVLNTCAEEKAKAARQRRIEAEQFNKNLVQQKKDFDKLERKAYRSYEHVEPYTSTANLV